MPTVKQLARDLLDDLPDTITWEELKDAIWTMEQIEIGTAELDRGETVPHSEVVRDLLGRA